MSFTVDHRSESFSQLWAEMSFWSMIEIPCDRQPKWGLEEHHVA
jgi:hypothetical protein